MAPTFACRDEIRASNYINNIKIMEVGVALPSAGTR